MQRFLCCLILHGNNRINTYTLTKYYKYKLNIMQTDRDNEVLEQAKKYIETTLTKGDVFSTSMIQRQFRTGYNVATRVLDLLEKEGYVKLDLKRIKAKVIYKY